MKTIKYKNQDGEVIELECSDFWTNIDPTVIAEAIALKEFRNRDLCEPVSWPREYEIFYNCEWHKVTVSMEYFPAFNAVYKGKVSK